MQLIVDACVVRPEGWHDCRRPLGNYVEAEVEPERSVAKQSIDAGFVLGEHLACEADRGPSCQSQDKPANHRPALSATPYANPSPDGRDSHPRGCVEQIARIVGSHLRPEEKGQ